jgi:hypothetical protein
MPRVLNRKKTLLWNILDRKTSVWNRKHILVLDRINQDWTEWHMYWTEKNTSGGNKYVFTGLEDNRRNQMYWWRRQEHATVRGLSSGRHQDETAGHMYIHLRHKDIWTNCTYSSVDQTVHLTRTMKTGQCLFVMTERNDLKLYLKKYRLSPVRCSFREEGYHMLPFFLYFLLLLVQWVWGGGHHLGPDNKHGKTHW